MNRCLGYSIVKDIAIIADNGMNFEATVVDFLGRLVVDIGIATKNSGAIVANRLTVEDFSKSSLGFDA